MKLFVISLFVLLLEIYASDSEIARARLESCPGCSLNRLQDVRKFAYEDIPNYENVEWKKISGAPPELVFLNSADEEVQRLPLSKLSRAECNELLTSRGFKQSKPKEL
ncbi:unnamed protein product [Phaedon cochleariae]|uniref:Selenoprotein M n=1 Tax=Phaedon cochleariae TaxID=80249 RepID=A0A9P0GSD7_PHACE|nr:unnamed protein product [Phaedon cochleariae]